MSKLQSSHGFVSLLYSVSDNPMSLWSKHVSSNGRIRRVEDDTLNGDRVIEISDSDDCPLSTSYISCPTKPVDCLNIKLPVLVIVLKGLKAKVEIAFQLIDEETIRRKFILSSCAENDKKQNETETARLSLKLAEGCWNLLEIDLQSICQKTYRTEFRALQRLIIYANCRIRRIYLQDRHYEQNETPVELCQAFFDMYMLKWGINFVEKSSQTDKTNQVATKASKIIHDVAAVADAVVNKRKLMPAAAVTGHSLKLQRSPRRNTKSLLLSRTKNDLSASTVRTKKERSTTRDSLSVSNDTAEKKAKIKSLVEIASTSSEKAYTCTGPESIRSEEILNGVMLKNPNIIAESLKMCTIPERKTARTLLPFIEPTEIPSEVEAEATENVESKQSKLLTTDEAVRDFLELRHAINSTILENFRVRGLTMTEVELSIYNSKNRRNSYGQGQLIEKHRTSVDKACHVVDSRHKIY